MLFTFRMAQKSLSELKNCHSGTSKPVPYSDGVTVVVVKKGHTAKFVDSNGQQGELLNFSVADKSASMLATLSDKTKHSKIVEGKTFLVRNFILKGGKITMSSKTSIMGKPSLEIPDEIRTSAVRLILPPSPEKKVAEVHTAPLRSICSVKGQVIKVIIALIPVVDVQSLYQYSSLFKIRSLLVHVLRFNNKSKYKLV